ncbi:unnamed protein product [Durusdinium trenchii]|uniref:Uncharacterized protein n=1 Tax=Durusdinium trenchii TaxID=1381693 RepID=A0ABP0IBK4_9DINO
MICKVWCMILGLFMALTVVMQVTLTMYIDLMSSRWVFPYGPGLALVAACLNSVLLLIAGTKLCYSAVWLMQDAWREDSFLAFRSLLLKENRSFERKDLLLQLAICVPLDVLPLMFGLWGNTTCFACLALTSFLEVFLFWFLEVVDDFLCKKRAIQQLFLSVSVPALQPWQSSSSTQLVTSTPRVLEVAHSSEPSSSERSAGSVQLQGCEIIRRSFLLRPWKLVVLLLVIFLMALISGTGILLGLALVSIALAVSHVYRLWAKGKWSFLKVHIESIQHREEICESVDEDFMVIRPISCLNQTVPTGYQIVNDGLLYDGQVRDCLSRYPVGARIHFRQEPLGKWCRFLEARCGGSSQQMFENGMAVLLVGLLVCSTLLQAGYIATGILCTVLLMIQISPAVCAVFLPQLAPYLHGAVSLGCGVMTFFLNFVVAPWNSMTFWLMPILALATHFLLLQRRFPHFRAVSVSLMMLVALLLALFLFLSIASALQPVTSYPHQQEVANFTFPAEGGAMKGVLLDGHDFKGLQVAHRCNNKQVDTFCLVAMASNLAMTSNLVAMASNLVAMASNPIAMATNLVAIASNLVVMMASNVIAMALFTW